MKKLSVIGATLMAAAMLCAAPISLHQSQDRGLSVSVDKAQAYYGHYRRVYRRGYYGHGYGHYGYAHRPYGYYGYRRYGYYGRPYVGGYYGHQRRVARRVYRRHYY